MLSCKTENIKPAEQKIFIYMRSVIKKILLVKKKKRRKELTNELSEN